MQREPTADEPTSAFDLLVVGGGINGAGIARDLAGRGLSVLLCEKDDLAAHTSSASTKLIHGGLRYLEFYDFRLVRKSLREREIVLSRVPDLAPGLADQLVKTVRALRAMELKKSPSISETLDWARTLLLLNAEHLSPDLVRSTLNVILKFEQDIASASEQLPRLLADVAKAA